MRSETPATLPFPPRHAITDECLCSVLCAPRPPRGFFFNPLLPLYSWNLLSPSGFCSASIVVVLVAQSCPTLWDPPLSMGFSRQEYWSGLPCPSPGDLPEPGIKPRSPASQADSWPSEPPGKGVLHSRASCVAPRPFPLLPDSFTWRNWA